MNSKLLALGAQKRFQGEREREERIRSQDLKLAGVMWPFTGSVRPFVFLVFLHMSFRPCMVLHRTRQHGCMRFFILQNNFENVLLFHHLSFFLQQQPSEIEF
jgi:hypothetical protein